MRSLDAQVGRAALQKGKFTWITEAGRQERWIVASCGAFTVLWNFRCALLLSILLWAMLMRSMKCSLLLTMQPAVLGGIPGRQNNMLCIWCCRQVKLAESAVQSYGGLTTVTEYHLIPRQEDVVDSTFMHDNYASPGAGCVSLRSLFGPEVHRRCVLIGALLAAPISERADIAY